MYELPTGGEGQQAAPSFGGVGNMAGRRYQVEWSPTTPAVLATCSFDRKVQVWSMAGAGGKPTKSGAKSRAPQWLRRPAGASFGFGGRLLAFGGSSDPRKKTPPVVKTCVREDAAATTSSTSTTPAVLLQLRARATTTAATYYYYH